MEDRTDSLFDNDDLLSILGADTKTALEDAMSQNTDRSDSDKKLAELAELASNLPDESRNQGSGNLDTDLSNWFNGEDKLPSEPLNDYTSNSMTKMDYGLSRNTITNFSMMGDLRKFLNESMQLMFDPNYTMSLSPADLEDRVKVGFMMYDRLYEMNRRTINMLKDFRLKSNGAEDESDKLKMLLSSIPTDKLKAILSELSK